jgi:hypothetical protein
MGTAGDTMARPGRGNTLAGDRTKEVQQKDLKEMMEPGKSDVCIAKEEEKEKRTSRNVAVCGVDEAKGPVETQLGRGIRGVVGGEGTVYDISPKSAFDDPERVVMLVVHEKDGQIRTDCKPEALKQKRGKKRKPHVEVH